MAIHPTCVDPHWGGLGVKEGLTQWLTVHPGGARLRVSDVSRQARRDRDAEVDAESLVIYRANLDRRDAERGGPALRAGVVTEWSAKSRARMIERFASLDYTRMQDQDGLPGMVTLTYPGDWRTVAPDGVTVKRHVRALQLRWFRESGQKLVGLWKLEFQRRGAPHVHILASVPALDSTGLRFELWLSRAWTEIVNPPDPTEYAKHLAAGTAIDFSAATTSIDPRRIAIYFLKHGTKTVDDKEYQHVVPEAWRSPGAGPGRFWGVWGLETASVVLRLDYDDYVAAKRVLRRLAIAGARKVAYQRAMHDARRAGLSPAACVRYASRAKGRRVRVLAGGSMVGGFLLVNDGVRLADDLARWLRTLRTAFEQPAWTPLEA